MQELNLGNWPTAEQEEALFRQLKDDFNSFNWGRVLEILERHGEFLGNDPDGALLLFRSEVFPGCDERVKKVFIGSGCELLIRLKRAEFHHLSSLYVQMLLEEGFKFGEGFSLAPTKLHVSAAAGKKLIARIGRNPEAWVQIHNL